MSLSLQKRATISDVARLAGVSITTVSRVVNGNAPVARDTALRVREAIGSLHYTPSSAARSLAGRRTNTVGLYLPQISGAFFSALFQGVEAGVREAGFDLLIHAHPQMDTNSPAGFPLGEHNTDGVLIFTHSVPDETIISLAERGLPLVLLFRSAPQGVLAHSIMIENQRSSQQLVDHLIEVHGRRRIAFLSGPEDNEDSQQREAGYRCSLEMHDLAYDPALAARGNFLGDQSYKAVRAWLQSGLEFDGLFAGDDESAIAGLRALREAGRRVPEDVSLVGFDDVSISSIIVPALTTVRVPIETAGLLAARQLISLIQTGQADLHQVLPTDVIIRQSCGCH